MRILDPAFGHPRGPLGRLGGALMARANAAQERWAVEHAGLRAGEQVVVVGPGPGVGLALAAEAVGPDGLVVGVDPSATMRRMARDRCAAAIAEGRVRVTEGSAERTRCQPGSMDAAVSVNNVMLWDRAAGFAELLRVLRPGGRLMVTVHRHVLDVPPARLAEDAAAAGFTAIGLSLRPRRLVGPAVQLAAMRPGG